MKTFVYISDRKVDLYYAEPQALTLEGVDIADRVRGRRNCAESAPIGVASRRSESAR